MGCFQKTNYIKILAKNLVRKSRIIVYFGMVQKIGRAIMELPPFNNNYKMIKKFSRSWFRKFQKNMAYLIEK